MRERGREGSLYLEMETRVGNCLYREKKVGSRADFHGRWEEAKHIFSVVLPNADPEMRATHNSRTLQSHFGESPRKLPREKVRVSCERGRGSSGVPRIGFKSRHWHRANRIFTPVTAGEHETAQIFPISSHCFLFSGHLPLSFPRMCHFWHCLS